MRTFGVLVMATVVLFAIASTASAHMWGYGYSGMSYGIPTGGTMIMPMYGVGNVDGNVDSNADYGREYKNEKTIQDKAADVHPMFIHLESGESSNYALVVCTAYEYKNR